MIILDIIDTQFDSVIDGMTAFGRVSYDYAFTNLVHLIDKTDFQRKLQDKRFYQKLERDLESGCVIPPLTVAFVTNEINVSSTDDEVRLYVEQNIQHSFVLDGIQRLNTLSRLENSVLLDKTKNLYINLIFCESVEKLLYRMITLNNGQRPMTPRHQVEMILSNVINFDELGITVFSEKDVVSKNEKYFKRSDIIQAYLAFMAETPLIDNKKIIQEKMDELLVGKIMDVSPSDYRTEFKAVIQCLSKFQAGAKSYKWLTITNNLVGFAVGVKKNPQLIYELTVEEFENAIMVFDEAFSILSPSKIKVGKYRRELSCEYFSNFPSYKDFGEFELSELFTNLTDV